LGLPFWPAKPTARWPLSATSRRNINGIVRRRRDSRGKTTEIFCRLIHTHSRGGMDTAKK